MFSQQPVTETRPQSIALIIGRGSIIIMRDDFSLLKKVNINKATIPAPLHDNKVFKIIDGGLMPSTNTSPPELQLKMVHVVIKRIQPMMLIAGLYAR